MNTDDIPTIEVLSVEPARNLNRVDAIDAELLIDGARCGVTLIPAWTPNARSMVTWGDPANWGDSATWAAVGMNSAAVVELERVVSEAAEAKRLGAWVSKPERFPPTLSAAGEVPRSMLRGFVDLDATPEQIELVDELTAATVRGIRFDHYGEFARWSAGCITMKRGGVYLTLWSEGARESVEDALRSLVADVDRMRAEGWTLTPDGCAPAGPALTTIERSDADTIARALADGLDAAPELEGLTVRSGPDGVILISAAGEPMDFDPARKLLESVAIPPDALAPGGPAGLAVVEGEG